MIILYNNFYTIIIYNNIYMIIIYNNIYMISICYANVSLVSTSKNYHSHIYMCVFVFIVIMYH